MQASLSQTKQPRSTTLLQGLAPIAFVAFAAWMVWMNGGQPIPFW